MGCIACHGGADPLMRAKVWTLAAVDTVRFLAGTYAEPTHMRLALRDADCRQCHRPILKPDGSSPPPATAPPPRAPAGAPAADSAVEAGYGAAPQDERGSSTNFHAIRDHGAAEGRCVRCHTSHTTDGDAPSRFLSPATVRPICRECHKEMLGALRRVR